MAYKTITLDPCGGESTSCLYYRSGKFYRDAELTVRYTASLNPVSAPTRECHSFLGYYSESTEGTLYINPDGTPTDAFLALAPTEDIVVYAQWERATYKITLDQSGGTGGTQNIYVAYVHMPGGGYYQAYSDDLGETEITSITPPSLSGFRFDGYYDTRGRNVVYGSRSTSGTINLSGYSTSSDETWTAHWLRDCKICTITKNGGTFETPCLYYADGTWYKDDSFEDEFSSSNPIAIPTKDCCSFKGCYDVNSDQGTLYIDQEGKPTAAFLAIEPTDDIVVYAIWKTESYKITVRHTSGITTSTVFFAKIGATGSGRFYADGSCTQQITGITPPRRELYAWNGCWSKSSPTTSGSVQYIEGDGYFTASLYGLSITENTTLAYGNQWTKISCKVIQNPNAEWTYVQPNYYVKLDGGGVYADWTCPSGQQLSTLPIPLKAGYRYIGSYSDNGTTSTLCVDKNGVIQSFLSGRSADLTIYPQGRDINIRLTLDANGGTGGTFLNYDATAGDEAFLDSSGQVVTSVTPPTYTGNAFLGYFTAQSGGTQVIDANGSILNSWIPTQSGTVYAQWGIDVSIIDVEKGDGSGGTSRFWYRGSTRKFYSDPELTNEITSVTIPTIGLFTTDGLYTESSGGTQAVSSAGVISDSWTPSGEFVQLYARYTRRCYRVIVPGATISAIYRNPSGSTWYSDESLSAAVSNVGTPTRTGYSFIGYKYGSTTVISSSGDILQAAAIASDYTANATWTVNSYTLYFDGNGSTPSFSSKSVTFGSSIGSLPTVSITGRRFEAWNIEGKDIKSTDVWNFGINKTAIARWKEYFGGLTDWFNLSSNLLMIVGSESGEGRKVTNLWNGSFEQGPGLVNPVCTYRIKAKGSVTIRLGKAFPSGFFITGFDYKTGADREPLLVVSGTANEGADAINLYDVTFQVDPDHVAQDPFGSVSGGGELVEMTSSAKCDPVVPYEDNRPCASDVVHGRKTVSGRTAAYFGENPPTFLNSFIDAGSPISESDVDFTTYSFTAERTII